MYQIPVLFKGKQYRTNNGIIVNVISAIHAALGEPNKAKDGDFGSNSAL